MIESTQEGATRRTAERVAERETERERLSVSEPSGWMVCNEYMKVCAAQSKSNYDSNM